MTLPAIATGGEAPPSSLMPWQQEWIPVFLEFLKRCNIPSKELKEPGPIEPYEAQYRFLRELDEGLTLGQHLYCILKARQLGMSTIMLILDIFWLYMHPGLQGALVADTDENRTQFRETITQVLDGLPKGFKIKVRKHNRSMLVLENGSRLQYMCAGKGKNPDLGRSRGLNFIHATELSSWGDQDGIHSLMDTLATENPNRLYILESTAKGYNVFWDLYRKAKIDPTQRPVFIGWWAKETYRIRQGTAEFDAWWTNNPVLTDAEKAMEGLVLRDYGWQLTTEQWAWWRKQQFDRSETNLLQEFPWHADVAFQVTGSPFFSIKRLNEDLNFVQTQVVTFSGYKYELPDTFDRMKCDEVYSATESELKIWEKPIRNARYAIGVDVAYGRSPTNDRHCIEVFRCFADKLVQVAEWATSIPETRTVAWVLAHLAGSYRDCMINLEVSGPGLQVMQEMKNLRQMIATAHLRNLEPIFEAKNALDMARWFLYHRPDTPGQGYMYNWKTNHDNKQEMFNGLRDSYNTERVIVRSVPLLEEMITLVQNGVSIQASARNKDDRPFATGLSHHAWQHWIRFSMMQENRTHAIEMAKQQQMLAEGKDVIQGIIPGFFQKRSAERREANIEALINAGYN